jgi:hypothetical protein
MTNPARAKRKRGKLYPMTTAQHHALVNALRRCIGLNPLYGRTVGKDGNEVSGEPGYGFLSICFDDGNRRIGAPGAAGRTVKVGG